MGEWRNFDEHSEEMINLINEMGLKVMTTFKHMDLAKRVDAGLLVGINFILALLEQNIQEEYREQMVNNVYLTLKKGMSHKFRLTKEEIDDKSAPS